MHRPNRFNEIPKMQKSKARAQKRFFKTTMVPGKAGGGKLFERKLVVADDVSVGSAEPGPIRCLGMTFESEEARCAYFLERLKAKLPELRERPDFPTAEDEDNILRLSDPPYYTACPNPFLAEFVAQHGKPYDPSGSLPSGAVRRGRERWQDWPPLPGPWLPHQSATFGDRAIHSSITPRPGDLVLDGFCGSGMTGVAAQWCGTAPEDYRRTLGTTVEEGRPTSPGVGSAPGYSGRSLASGDVHRSQLQHPL